MSYEDGIKVVSIKRVLGRNSKYKCIARMLDKAKEKAVCIDTEIFKIKPTNVRKKIFVNNFKLFHRKEYGNSVNGVIHQDSIYFWKGAK